MKLAARMSRLGTETAFEALAAARALEAEGRSIIHLGIGEPDFDTPEHIRDAAKGALDQGHTHYTPSPGMMGVREAIARHQAERQGYAVGAESIVVTPGGKPVMFFTILALTTSQAAAAAPRAVGTRPQLLLDSRVVDATNESFVFEMTGNTAKINAFIELMTPLGLADVSRTGVVAISRGAESF